LSVDLLIDRLVQQINSSPRESKPDHEVPPELRLTMDSLGWWDWTVKRSDHINWIEPLETKLPSRFPSSFRSLVTRYEFPAIEVGPLILFANTSGGTYYQLRERIFADKSLSHCLLQNGLIQFGLPNTGSYDPVCFDTRKPAHESPILWLDHEEILCNERICVVQEVAKSFYDLVANVTAAH